MGTTLDWRELFPHFFVVLRCPPLLRELRDFGSRCCESQKFLLPQKESPPDLPGGYTAREDPAEMVGGMYRRTDDDSLDCGTASGKWSGRDDLMMTPAVDREPHCSIWSRRHAPGTGASGGMVSVKARLPSFIPFTELRDAEA